MRGRAAWVPMLLPALALFLLMSVGPALLGIAMSGYRITWDKQQWVGLGNFRFLFSDPIFRRALANTGMYVAIIVPAVEILGLVVALAAHSLPGRAKSVVRATVYLANRVSGVALLGSWMYLWATRGIVNKVLGIETNWYAQPLTAFALVCITAVVWNWGGALIVLLAALDGQPQEVQEAALLDGATGWQRFRYVTFPMLRRVILYRAVFSVIGITQLYEVILLFTRSNPNNSTNSIGFYLFQQGQHGDYGLAGAVGVVEAVLIGALAWLQVRWWKER